MSCLYRIDLRNDPDYRNEVTGLSDMQPPVEQFFELTPEQSRFYDEIIGGYFGEGGSFRGCLYQPFLYDGTEKAETARQDSRSMRVRALNNLEAAEMRMRGDAAPAAVFLPTLRVAIDRFCSLSDYTLRRLGRSDLNSESQLKKFMEQVENLRQKLGDAYLDDLNRLSATTRSEIIVAIELRQSPGG